MPRSSAPPIVEGTATPTGRRTATVRVTWPPTSWRSWTRAVSSAPCSWGTRLGTFVAQQAALAAPDRVAGLVLIGSAPSARNEVTLEVQRSLAPLPETVPEEFVKEFQLSTMHQPTPDEFLAGVVAESLKVPSRVWRAALGGLLEEERFTGLGESRTPVLLLWGELDAMFSRADQEALLAALPAATLRVYHETGHAPHWERPSEVVRDLEGFLRTTLA